MFFFAVSDDRYSTGYVGSGSAGFRKRGPLVDSVLSSFAFILGIQQTPNIYFSF